MARSHARLLLTVWSDQDWRALPMAAQWLYEALISQADINQAGVLTLAVRRWSNLAADLDAGTVEVALKALVDHRFVIVDDDTEEVLVRTFIRNDQVYRQPNTLKNALRCAQAVQSPLLRRALAAELRRLDPAAVAALRVPHGHEHPAPLLATTLAVLVPDEPTPPPHPHGTTPSEGYGDGYREPIAVPKGVPPGEGEGVSPSPNQTSRRGATHARTRATPTPHEPRCEKPCRVCRDARIADEALDRQAEQATADARTAELRARAACRLCDADGWQLPPPDQRHRGPTTTRCDHRPHLTAVQEATA